MDALNPSPLEQVPAALHKQGWAVISADTLLNWLRTDQATADAVHASWNDLRPTSTCATVAITVFGVTAASSWTSPPAL